ncbi:MAG: response regulator [Chloroflexota bacterium]
MSKSYSGSAVPRHFVFIMSDGTFVVQWDESRVQDLLSGQYLPLRDDGFGHAISDYELDQLKSAGRVEFYNRAWVWLYALPEPNRFQTELKTQERVADRVRAFYLNTTLPKSQLENIRSLLQNLGLGEDFSVMGRAGLVAVAGRDGNPFLHFKEAEQIQKELTVKAPDMFHDSAIAFIEMRQEDVDNNQDVKRPEDNTDLATIIASQSDTSLTFGKRMVLLVTDEAERNAICELCQEMQMDVRVAEASWEAIQLLEDGHSDIFLMDLELPDIHGWALISKLKEIGSLRDLPIIVVAKHSTSDRQSLAFTVANIDLYLVKPVSKARLRQNIWMSLKNHAAR